MRRGGNLLPVMWLHSAYPPKTLNTASPNTSWDVETIRSGAKISEKGSWLQPGELAARNSRHLSKAPHRLIEPQVGGIPKSVAQKCGTTLRLVTCAAAGDHVDMSACQARFQRAIDGTFDGGARAGLATNWQSRVELT